MDEKLASLLREAAELFLEVADINRFESPEVYKGHAEAFAERVREAFLVVS